MWKDKQAFIKNRYRCVVKNKWTPENGWTVRVRNKKGKLVKLKKWGSQGVEDEEIAPLIGYACDGPCDMFGTDMDFYEVPGKGALCMECALQHVESNGTV